MQRSPSCNLLLLAATALCCACAGPAGTDDPPGQSDAIERGRADVPGDAKAASCACDPSLDTLCAVQVFDPATGSCKPVPRNNDAACEDGDPCTIGDRCDKGACAAGGANACECQQTKDCAGREDGDLCNGTLYCDVQLYPYRCRIDPASVVTCATSTEVCSTTACEPASGKCSTAPVADGKACDDGNNCTVNDACLSGKCAGGDDTCTCKTSADCDAQEDGNLCNGVLYCDAAASPPVCKVNPATVVKCASAGDKACTKNLCNPVTGACAMQPVKPGTSCDDGDKCTAAEICVAGQCTGGTNVCKCSSDKDCADKDDGDLCNGTLFCDVATGGCLHNPASVVTCPTVNDTACAKAACVPLTGACAMAPTATNTACNDNDACTVGDYCKDGGCLPGTFQCACTSDAECEAKQGDGDLCNGTLFCNKTTGKCALNDATKVSCPAASGTTCVPNQCVPKTGKCALSPAPNGTSCDDGNPCTASDICLFGKCEGANTCECQLHADCASRDDGNLCNGTWFCDTSNKAAPKCAFNKASVVFCPPADKACVANLCNPLSGACNLQPQPDGTTCDDGDKCSSASACAAGKCGATKALACNDSNPCTFDTCNPAAGCVHTAKSCDDGNACTDDSCNKADGTCSNDAKPLQGKVCNGDNSGCTVNDRCQAGKCVIGPPITCASPADQCAKAVCQSNGSDAFQCATVPKDDGEACDDGDSCTLQSACVGSACKATGHGLFETLSIAPKSGKLGRFRAVLRLPGGGVVAAGSAWSGAAGKPTAMATWVVQLDAKRNTLLDVEIPSALAHPDVGAVQGLQVLPSGHIVVIGTGGHKDGHTDVQVAVLLPNGQPYLVKQVGEAGDERAQRSIRHPDGTGTIAGSVVTKKGNYGQMRSALVTRVSSLGGMQWSNVLPPTQLGNDMRAEAFGLAEAPGGLVIVVGETTAKISGVVAQAYAQGIDKAGKTAWTASLGEPLGNGLRSVAMLSPQVAVVGGWTKRSDGVHPLLARVAIDGRVLAQIAPPTLGEVRSIHRRSDGNVGAVGQLFGSFGGPDIAWHVALDPLFNLHATVSLSTGAAGKGAAVAETAVRHEKGMVAAGAHDQGAGSRGLLAFTDPWGAASCAASGSCATKVLADCADKLACTADVCDGGKGGCQHVAGVGFACDVGDGCNLGGVCAGTSCKGNGQTKLYARTYGPGTLNSVRPTSDGGVVMAGLASSPTWLLRRLSASGDVMWAMPTDSLTNGGLAGERGAMVGLQMADGSISAVGQTVKNNKHVPVIRRLDGGSGKVLSSVDVPVSSNNFLRRAITTADRGALFLSLDIIGVTRIQKWRQSAAQWTVQLTQSGPAGSNNRIAPISLAAEPSGGVVFATTIGYSTSQRRQLVGRISTVGKLVFTRTIATNGTVYTRSITPLGDGYALTGLSLAGNVGNGAFVALNSALNAVFSKVAGPPPASCAKHHSGLLCATAPADTNLGIQRLVAARHDAYANALQALDLTMPGKSMSTGVDALAAMPDGGFVLGGHASDGANTVIYLARADFAGHTSCAAAGKCLGASAAQCDDGKPCTVDSCDGAKGCVHQPLADGVVCNGAGNQCKQGACAVP